MNNIAIHSENAASCGELQKILSAHLRIEKFGHHSHAENIDLLVIEMTPAISFDVLRKLAASVPNIGIIVWTDNVSAELVSDCLSLGIRGVLSKSATAEAHTRCLGEVAEGRLWIDQALGASLLGAPDSDLPLRHPQHRRRVSVQAPPWRVARPGNLPYTAQMQRHNSER